MTQQELRKQYENENKPRKAMEMLSGMGHSKYVEWLENYVMDLKQNVCPKCGCTDIVLTIYCNNCHESY
jgi:hypothetical protein